MRCRPQTPRRVGRLRGRRLFADLRRDGARHRSGPIVITTLAAEGHSGPRVAYAVPRTVGPAVVRNRLRRRLRAISRELDLPPGSYLVSTQPPAAQLGYAELADHMQRALGR